MTRLPSYRKYLITVDEGGYFYAFATESETLTRGNQVASADTLRGLHTNLDNLEKTTKRDRDRPEFPVINAMGIRGKVKGIHAGTGSPNATMQPGGGRDTHILYYDVPLVRQMVEARRDLLGQAHELEEALNNEYRLPVLHYGHKNAEGVLHAEENMRLKWADLSAGLLDDMTIEDVLEAFTTKRAETAEAKTRAR